MTSTPRTTAAALIAAAALTFSAGPAAAAHISMSINSDDEVRLDGEDVVIRAEDHSEARITPQGALRIRGKNVPVSPATRATLARYNDGVHYIEDRAMELGMQGAGIAASAIGEAIAAVFTGDEHGAERRIERKAENLKQAARELCEEAFTLQDLQEDVALSVPAFRPYAVIDMDDEDCQVDD